jgi:hypothetical protein
VETETEDAKAECYPVTPDAGADEMKRQGGRGAGRDSVAASISAL